MDDGAGLEVARSWRIRGVMESRVGREESSDGVLVGGLEDTGGLIHVS